MPRLFEDHSRYQCIAGVDEVGRGPLIGDVVTAAVILKLGDHIEGVTDSKKLTAKKREYLAEQIKQRALCYAIGRASPAEIDEINILHASLLAMRRAVEALSIQPDFVLVDGNKLPQWSYAAKAIVKGDALEPAIGAASILAKVQRDNEMLTLHEEHPEYGFASHKGYPTKQHLQALEKFGVLAQHRRSFGPVRAMVDA